MGCMDGREGGRERGRKGRREGGREGGKGKGIGKEDAWRQGGGQSEGHTNGGANKISTLHLRTDPLPHHHCPQYAGQRVSSLPVSDLWPLSPHQQ